MTQAPFRPFQESGALLSFNPTTGNVDGISAPNGFKTTFLTTSSFRKAAALVGSSLTDVGITSNTLYGTRRRLNRSWFDWMNYALRERAMDFPVSYAVGGSPISTILAQIQVPASAA